MNYFDKIPTIIYGGRAAKNLITKAQFSEQTRNNKLLYYPYTLPDSMRADNLSNKYYDNPGYSWLIWMTNNIIDPYYGLPLSEEEFRRFITSKYGSVELAKRSIKCWRSNWYRDDTRLTLAQYETLSFNHKKYYDPVLNNNLQVVGYKRKQENTLINTNAAYELKVTNTLTQGSLIGSNDWYATIAYADESSIIIEKVIGLPEVGDAINSNIITQVTLRSATSAFTDADFWEPVSLWDYEYDINEGKKHIKLLDNRYRNQVTAELERVMNT